jgi:hypothetical protein
MHVITDDITCTGPPGDLLDVTDPLQNGAPPRTSASATTPSAVMDQRMPGHLEQITPTLIPPLREPVRYVSDPDFDSDPLAPARGIAVGIALSVPFWALTGLAVWFVL